MKKTFESKLPEGYREVYHIDAANIKIGILLNLIALVLMIVSLIICVILIRPASFTFTMGPWFGMLAVLLLYGMAEVLLSRLVGFASLSFLLVSGIFTEIERRAFHK